MADTNGPRALHRRQRLWAALALLVLLLLAGGVYAYRRIAPYGQTGGAYIAKQLCSCVFLTGRSEASCRAEFKPDIDRFAVRVNRSGAPARGRVTATLAVFRGEATYAEGYGCTVAR